MPIINGMKMACEPCIRGHRSTKCTHANERLMVPVRKPGRPLSACPHPQNQACGCGTVTAAIPRKQTCHCGTGNENTSHQNTWTDTTKPPPAETPSPTKTAFKVQKSSRPPSSRKQSFDPSNLERMDMTQVNLQPAHQRPTPAGFPGGFTIPGIQQTNGYTPQCADTQPHYGMGVPMQPPPHPHLVDTQKIRESAATAYGSGPYLPQQTGPSTSETHHYGGSGFLPRQNGLEDVLESPLTTPTGSGSSNTFSQGGSTDSEAIPAKAPGEAKKSGSCCSPKKPSHSQSSSAGSIAEEPEMKNGGSCCSSKNKSQPLKQDPISNGGTPHMSHGMLPQNNAVFPMGMQEEYHIPQTFTYPATWGSFQNPLQPSAWRESMMSNNYTPITASLAPGSLSFETPVLPESLSTVHMCGCGDGCLCVGCAAHPYNQPTQDYVRAAYEASIAFQRPPGEVFGNGPSGGMVANTQAEGVSSPTVQTPSSATGSVNGDEQILSESDFFFVNYSYTSDGCGGDMQSCPCGDDCQCLGCTIHRQPILPCVGEGEVCMCGDDCQCIGCEIHKNAHPAAESEQENGPPKKSSCCG